MCTLLPHVNNPWIYHPWFALTCILTPKGRLQTSSHRNLYFGELLNFLIFFLRSIELANYKRGKKKKNLRCTPFNEYNKQILRFKSHLPFFLLTQMPHLKIKPHKNTMIMSKIDYASIITTWFHDSTLIHIHLQS